MKFSAFIGIDPSQIDFEVSSLSASLSEDNIAALGKFENKNDGFILFEGEIRSLGHHPGKTLICIEHMGPYNESLAEFLYQKGWSVWLASPLLIHKSAGMLIRGKTDKLDSKRICMFGKRFEDKAKIFAPAPDWKNELQALTKLRRQLVDDRTRLQNRSHANNSKARPCSMTCEINNSLLDQLNQQIDKVECRIEEICGADPSVKTTHKILNSIPGIGKVISVRLVQATGAMTTVDSFRQLSVMARSAPFPYESGTSIKRRPRTSKLGDKKLKADLYMGALRVTHEGQLFHDYYKYRKSIGKPHNSIINDIVNKMLKLAFDLCKKCEMFDINRYLNAKKSLAIPLTLS